MADPERPSGAAPLAQLRELLGLDEEELCAVLGLTPLELLAGEGDAHPQLRLLATLVGQAASQVNPGVIASWVRRNGPAGRPIEMLLRRDFSAFELALDELTSRGFVIRRAE